MKLRMKLYPAQLKAWNSDKKIVAFIGGIGCGKTYLGIRWLAREVLKAPNESFLIVAPTYGMLNKVVLPQALDFYKNIFRGEYQVLKRQFVFPSGGRIIFGSADNPLLMEGVHYKAVWFDEAGQAKRDAWDVIRRRVALKKGRILITTTPYELNWLKFEVYDEWAKGNSNIDVIQARSIDNPFFPHEEYERAKAELPDWQFRMFYEGDFTKPSGLVYSDFDYSEHVKELDMSMYRLKIVGVDWGFRDPSAVIFIAILPDNTWYVYNEIYEEGLTQDALVEKIKRYYDEVWRIYIDPSQPSLIKSLAPKAVAGLNDLVEGISAVTSLIRTKRLIINPNCKNLIYEFLNYMWNEKGKPQDNYNHALDALRYAVYTYSKRPLPKLVYVDIR